MYKLFFFAKMSSGAGRKLRACIVLIYLATAVKSEEITATKCVYDAINHLKLECNPSEKIEVVLASYWFYGCTRKYPQIDVCCTEGPFCYEYISNNNPAAYHGLIKTCSNEQTCTYQAHAGVAKACAGNIYGSWHSYTTSITYRCVQEGKESTYWTTQTKDDNKVATTLTTEEETHHAPDSMKTNNPQQDEVTTVYLKPTPNKNEQSATTDAEAQRLTPAHNGENTRIVESKPYGGIQDQDKGVLIMTAGIAGSVLLGVIGLGIVIYRWRRKKPLHAVGTENDPSFTFHPMPGNVFTMSSSSNMKRPVSHTQITDEKSNALYFAYGYKELSADGTKGNSNFTSDNRIDMVADENTATDNSIHNHM